MGETREEAEQTVGQIYFRYSVNVYADRESRLQQFTPLAEASSLGYRPPALSLDQFLGAGQDRPGRFRSHWGIENDPRHV